MTQTAEWWINECGGVFCSHCGLFFDDYYEDAPKQCPGCNYIMSSGNDTYMIIDSRYRLSRLLEAEYIDESEYPEWLSKLRKEYLIRHSRN